MLSKRLNNRSFLQLTTYFDGEIISKKHPFLTRKWDADENVDRKHWVNSKYVLIKLKKLMISYFQGQFVSFYPFTKNFNNDSFDYSVLSNTDYVYMRWKEHFLIPDHNIRSITGATFGGFYYICFQKSTSKIEGYYFSKNNNNSDW